MRHRVFGKQLSRNTSHRRSLRRNMAASLFEHGTIRTTTVKAKELRPFVEKLITVARVNTLNARRMVISMLRDRDIVSVDGELADKTVVQKLFDEIAPRYANRPGGYTRIIRLSERRIGDAGKQVLLQLVEDKTTRGESKGGQSRRQKRATKMYQAASAKPAKATKAAAAAEGEPAAEGEAQA
ncbi:MAG: 50S ribosomal protein L17 [Phycisphaerae bacterium]|jgi:large subunit ribosomal protein L17